ncbi:MAG TPA: hypothetical protein VEI97_09480 [bacterium]|nr:hypothetical protein [bacterium]
MADKYGSSLTMENFKSVLDDAGGHTREAFIDFTVWGIRTFGTFGTFAALLGFSAILIGPFGLVLTAAVIYTYSKYRSEVDAQTGKPAEVTAEDVPPADSSPTPSADPVDVPRTPLPGAGPG